MEGIVILQLSQDIENLATRIAILKATYTEDKATEIYKLEQEKQNKKLELLNILLGGK